MKKKQKGFTLILVIIALITFSAFSIILARNATIFAAMTNNSHASKACQNLNDSALAWAQNKINTGFSAAAQKTFTLNTSAFHIPDANLTATFQPKNKDQTVNITIEASCRKGRWRQRSQNTYTLKKP